MRTTLKHSWCTSDGKYGIDQTIILEGEDGKGMLLLYRDANIIGHHELVVHGNIEIASTVFAGLETLHHDKFVRLMQGPDSYGADLRTIAGAIGLGYEGPTPEEDPNLPEIED